MSGINSKIQKKEFERRLHILKGFSNIEEVATVQIAELEKAVGAGNIYETSGLKKMTQDVLKKGDKAEIFKAKKFISNLHPVNVLGEDGLPTTLFIEKGHMDFGSGKPKNSNLVQKKVTDKNGHQTTRYVKNGEDVKEDESGQSDIDKETAESDAKTNEDWVSETSSEDLKKFVDTADDDQIDLIEMAEEELMKRGDIGSSNNEESDENFNEDGKNSEPYQTPSGESIEQFYSMDEAGQRSVLEASMKHNIPLGAALAMMNESSGDNEETHAKIDAAQAALDDLKGHTNHPDVPPIGEETFNANDPTDMANYLLADSEMASKLKGSTVEELFANYTTDELWELATELKEQNQNLSNTEAPDADAYNESGSDLNDIASHFGEDAATMVERTIKPEGYSQAYEFIAANPEAMDMSDEEFTAAFVNENNKDSDDEVGYDDDEDNGYGKTEDNRPEEKDVDVDGNDASEEDEGENSKNDSVRSWIGEDYKDEHIQSVIDSLEEVEELDYYLPEQPDFESQEEESEWYDSMATDASNDIQDGNWHSDMDRNDVKNVIWGLLKVKNQ